MVISRFFIYKLVAFEPSFIVLDWYQVDIRLSTVSILKKELLTFYQSDHMLVFGWQVNLGFHMKILPMDI